MSCNPRKEWVIVLFCFAIFNAAYSAVAAPPTGVRCVQPDGSDTGNAGTDWGSTNAWQTIEHALDRVNNHPEDAITEIWLAQGTGGFKYKQASGHPEYSWTVLKAVAIRGGFDGESDAAARDPGTMSTLSGAIGGGDNTYHLMVVNPSTSSSVVTLDRLKLECGDATASGVEEAGGAIRAYLSGEPTDYGGPLVLIDCVFESNKASGFGGAISADSFDIVADRCTFHNNSVQGIWAGLGYGAARGGALFMHISRFRATSTSFVGNSVVGAHSAATSLGGAIACQRLDIIHCVNCTFTDNSCTVGSNGAGGAVHALLGGDPWPETKEEADISLIPIFANCKFQGNSAGAVGGAIYCEDGALVTSCTLVGNGVSGEGGGLFTDAVAAGAIVIQNTIFWGNTAGGSGDDLEKQFAPLDAEGESDVFAVARSCVQDLNASFDLTDNNINADPDFADAQLHLSHCSPALSTADADLLPADPLDVNGNSDYGEMHPWDLDRMKRFVFDDPDFVLDMGVYQSTCRGDVNRDGAIDGADLGAVLGAWGSCPLCLADFDCSDTVDGADLGVVLGAWDEHCDDFAPMFASGEGSAMELLMAYMGVETAEDLTEALVELSFGEMSEILESFLGIE